MGGFPDPNWRFENNPSEADLAALKNAHAREVERLRKQVDEASWAFHRAIASKQALRDEISSLRSMVNVLQSSAPTENHHDLLREARSLNEAQVNRISELRAEVDNLKATRSLALDGVAERVEAITGLRSRLASIAHMTKEYI